MDDKLIESIKNYVLNNMGNREFMHLVHYLETREDYHKEIAALKLALKEFVEMGEFYANKEAWQSIYVGYGEKSQIKHFDLEDLSENDVCDIYGGKRARETLLKHRELLDQINKDNP